MWSHIESPYSNNQTANKARNTVVMLTPPVGHLLLGIITKLPHFICFLLELFLSPLPSRNLWCPNPTWRETFLLSRQTDTTEHVDNIPLSGVIKFPVCSIRPHPDAFPRKICKLWVIATNFFFREKYSGATEKILKVAFQGNQTFHLWKGWLEKETLKHGIRKPETGNPESNPASRYSDECDKNNYRHIGKKYFFATRFLCFTSTANCNC